ncbi:MULTISPECIES: pentapeptide repeat-containing protein [unclassified Romboutsia]|uniref:pentapeptide repeat-containing protein n=1 Tax=unclassified Romboutsia TaxID=2626894 RepID=UPI00189ED935|nr:MULTISPECIES: pentapeptide repeat-containing protein [unclassified Romboutsia]MDB8800851.1 pentapeptide repeat-containing protein [Romboutsia sp. 1001216sp1]MDB8803869.1 pentapeptide repeat-containing protein [Romboutsia sp. 1001216sp1]MDB8806781.1 pentapeptide repeat-containing protein [Romboutsia sp. 1001216sp1]MDB8809516.1 pentapeptide repeat-containing protein [Romboutsia sp. 1001216sp1]MDB8812250.1 pentapeptide repeat-containing protein [Romboutsia sp. 1001216sp1]
MSVVYKIEKPKTYSDLQECSNIVELIINEESIENKIIEDTVISDIYNIRISFNSCVFKNIIFEECDLKKIDIVDCIFENCDLSNIDISDSSIYRTEFINCKLIGSRFDDSLMKNVVFKDTIGIYSNFSYAKLKNICFKDSNFRNSVFQEIESKGLILESTDLTKSVFRGSSLDKVDLTTCNIDSLEVSIKDVSGGIFTPIQALELTKLMNIVVK